MDKSPRPPCLVLHLGLLLWIEKNILVFSGSDQHDDEDEPVLVIEPQPIIDWRIWRGNTNKKNLLLMLEFQM